MTTEFVTVPREPTREMLIAANAAWFIPDPSPFNKGDEARRAIYKAMLAAAPPAASVRAMELAWIEDRFGDEFATPAADQRYTVQALADGEWLALRNGERLNGEPEDVIYGTRAAGKAACQQHFNAYVRTLLAPTVDEAAPLTESAEAPVAWRYVRGMSSYIDQGPPPTQEEYGMFDSITPLYTHPAPASAGEGVTDMFVDAVYTAINRLGTPISQATVQTAIVLAQLEIDIAISQKEIQP